MSKPLILELKEKADEIGKVISTSNGSYVKFENGALIQWGSNTGVNNSYREVTFPCPFVNKTRTVVAKTNVVDTNYYHDVQVANVSTTSFRAYVRYQGSAGGAWSIGGNNFNWFAVGSWK